MTGSSSRRLISRIVNHQILLVGIIVIASVLAFAALVLPIIWSANTFVLDVGDVAPQDILAPGSITYVSDVLTEQARKSAEKAVTNVYLPIDPNISRQQLEKLRVALNYISVIRLDGFASLDQKLADLTALPEPQLDRTVAERILALTEAQWQAIQQETLNVLEETMRSTLRSDQVKTAQANIPTLIRFSFSLEQAELITRLVTPFVVANSLYSEELTEVEREKARESVFPVSKQFVSGETIVRRGQLLTAVDVEALSKLELIRTGSNTEILISAAALVIVINLVLGFYVFRFRPNSLRSAVNVLFISIWFLVLLGLARGFTFNHTVLPYLFPLSAFALVTASFFSIEVGFISALAISVFAVFGINNPFELSMFYLLPSLTGIFVLGKGQRISNFFQAGLVIGFTGSLIIVIFRFLSASSDWIGIATLIGAAFLNGIAAASLTLLVQYLFSQMLGITTALQLHDLARADHPLLQFILHNAPGTYQHSLQVANLTEQAAEVINADALLCRVGALYHDAGKANNPSFFIENQVPGQIDTHDDLDPSTVAGTIIQHVHDGVLLAKKYRLPKRISDFILEHHGTLFTRYQYSQALQQAGKDNTVDITRFQYPGPAPRSKETALLMLADGCEARARAELPKDETELRSLIRKSIDSIVQSGQLDNTDLTLNDLNLITESFTKSLQNTYHPRIRYPEIKPSIKKNSSSG